MAFGNDMLGPLGGEQPMGIMDEMRAAHGEHDVGPLELQDLIGGKGPEGIQELGMGEDPYGAPGGMGMPQGMPGPAQGMGQAPEPQNPEALDEKYDREFMLKEMRAMYLQRAQERAANSKKFQDRAYEMNQEI